MSGTTAGPKLMLSARSFPSSGFAIHILVPHVLSTTHPTVAARIECGGPSSPVGVGSRVFIDGDDTVELVVMSFNLSLIHI